MQHLAQSGAGLLQMSLEAISVRLPAAFDESDRGYHRRKPERRRAREVHGRHALRRSQQLRGRKLHHCRGCDVVSWLV